MQFESPSSAESVSLPKESSFSTDVLVNTAAFGAICFNYSNFCRIFVRVNFLQDQPYKSGAIHLYYLAQCLTQVHPPLTCLKIYLPEELVQLVFLFFYLFEPHNLLTGATFFSSNSAHACILSNKAATWLHAEPSLK